MRTILLRTAFGAAARPTFVGLAIASLAFTLLACSGTSPPPPQPPMHVGSGGAVAQAPAPESPSTAECEALVAHAIDLDARTRDTQPPPTDAEREQLRATLRPFIEECRAMSRASYECGRAATTPAQLASCQRTPSSSTSNSSVAPPGITPAAPRSP
ncbi:MAG: hypothetical protein SFX73_33660 [Kofleriaceae bacterium]|nr:hypothetical protein [Kofleriaceae bacterium]